MVAHVKLRILGNTVRLRLGQGEVERFSAGDVVEEVTRFGVGAELRYSVRLERGGARVWARYVGGAIELFVPQAEGEAWATGGDVSIVGAQAVDGGELSILIEKDFRCLTPRGAEDDDAFPNPNDSC